MFKNDTIHIVGIRNDPETAKLTVFMYPINHLRKK